MIAQRAELGLDTDCPLGEGPVWHLGALWFVDILDGRLHRYDPVGGSHASWKSGGLLGFAAPSDDGDWVVGLNAAIARWAPGVRPPEVVTQVAPDSDVRLNDGKCDPTGRLYAGTIGHRMTRGAATLYRFDRSLAAEPVVRGVTVSNGLAWNAALGAMYYVDTPTRRIDRFEWDPETGAIVGRRSAYAFPDGGGSPDGMSIDVEGRLWVAMWDGARVACVDPEAGEEILSIPVPCPNVTSCCFGGAKLDELWITTASVGMNDEARARHPKAGAVFVARLEVAGTPATPCVMPVTPSPAR